MANGPDHAETGFALMTLARALKEVWGGSTAPTGRSLISSSVVPALRRPLPEPRLAGWPFRAPGSASTPRALWARSRLGVEHTRILPAWGTAIDARTAHARSPRPRHRGAWRIALLNSLHCPMLRNTRSCLAIPERRRPGLTAWRPDSGRGMRVLHLRRDPVAASITCLNRDARAAPLEDYTECGPEGPG